MFPMLKDISYFKAVEDVAHEVVASRRGKASITFPHHSSGVKVPFKDLADV
jgi:hypothetical protein